jgi:glutathione peroxidase
MLKKYYLIFIIALFQITILSCSKSTSQNSSIQQTKTNPEGNKNLNKNIYDLTVKTMDGETKKLSDYKGKVLLIVNVASKCGFTPQYEGLENIYKKYNDKGFEILAFPCNDFGEQEPGTNDEIRTFCESKYDVTFPLFDKIEVLGDNKSPLYERLINNSEPTGDIDWNFEKFVIDKNGDIVGRFKSKVKPESEELSGVIETELSK